MLGLVTGIIGADHEILEVVDTGLSKLSRTNSGSVAATFWTTCPVLLGVLLVMDVPEFLFLNIPNLRSPFRKAKDCFSVYDFSEGVVERLEKVDWERVKGG